MPNETDENARARLASMKAPDNMYPGDLGPLVPLSLAEATHKIYSLELRVAELEKRK